MDQFEQALAEQLGAYNAGGVDVPQTYPNYDEGAGFDEEPSFDDQEDGDDDYIPSPPASPVIDPTLLATAPQTTTTGRRTKQAKGRVTKPRATNPNIKKSLQCPYKCRDAAGQYRKFANKHNLDQHVREKHTLTREYKCHVCGDQSRGFNRPYTLYRHLRTSHGITVETHRGKPAVKTQHQREVEEAAAAREVEMEERRANNPAIAKGNEEFDEVQCYQCDVVCMSRELLLGHLHQDHEVPASEYCNCQACTAAFGGELLSQQPVQQQEPQIDTALEFVGPDAEGLDWDFGDKNMQVGFGLDGEHDGLGGAGFDEDFDFNDLDNVFGRMAAGEQQ
jgi:hypothetical protein